MGKRFVSVLLLAVFCMSLLAVPAAALYADDPLYSDWGGQVDTPERPDDTIQIDPDITIGQLETSEAGIEFIKAREGFLPQPYFDVSQMSIGYGCSTVYAAKYGFSTTNITESEAEQLLLCVVAEHEQALDRFLTANHVTALSQTEYDALISFSFNVGTSWLNSNYRLAKLLIEGNYTINEFASAMGIWCHVGKEIDKSLIVRRIYEIKLFLYGVYELDDTYNKFCYLIFDGNGGSPEVDIAFFLEGEPYGSLFTAEKEGQYFEGWYTEGGAKITSSTVVSDDLTVYARWSDAPVPDYVEAVTAFSDISANAWYYDYVNDLYNEGVIDGYLDHTFKPNNNVNTGEALKMIILAAGYEEPAPVASHWARNYLNLCLDEGIIQRGEITDLDVTINRSLVAKIVVNALVLPLYEGSSPFLDTDNTYAATLYTYGIMNGTGNDRFEPNRALTRAELAAIVWRVSRYRQSIDY